MTVWCIGGRATHRAANETAREPGNPAVAAQGTRLVRGVRDAG